MQDEERARVCVTDVRALPGVRPLVCTQEELVQGMKALGTVLNENDIDELKGLLGLSKSTKGIEVNKEQFKKIVEQTPAASAGGTETGAWITQLNLYESFIPLIDDYEYLREPDDDMSAQDKLAHVRGLQEADVRQIVEDASELLVGKLLAGIKALKDLFDERLASSRDVNAQGNSKFSGDASGGQITMVYGKLDEFHEGLESMIGLPNPRIMEGMMYVHYVHVHYGGHHVCAPGLCTWGIMCMRVCRV